MTTNYQQHWYPKSYLDLIEGREAYPRTTYLGDGVYYYEMGAHPGAWKFKIDSKFWDIDRQVADMDAAGIDRAVISPNMLGEVDLVDLGEAKETIAHINEEVAAAQRKYPERLVGLAMLPMQDADAAIEALDRAVELDLRGVLMTSNLAGHAQGNEPSWPIYSRINDHGLPLFIHPSSNSMVIDRGLHWLVDTTAGWMYESSSAALQLIVNGVLDRNPNIEVVHYHLGGIIPYVAGRVGRFTSMILDLEHPLDHYLRTRFYVDICCHSARPIPLAEETYGADRLLYGDDYPWNPHETTMSILKNQIDPTLGAKILNTNRVKTLRMG